MNAKSQIIAAWCGPAMMVLMGIGWVLLAGYFPPHSPTLSGADMAAFYQAHPVRIRFGLLITLWGTAFYVPFTAVLSLQMARIEGSVPVWSWTQLAAGAGATLTIAFPIMFWATAAFRPDRNPELLLLLDDLAWIPFAGMTIPILLMPILIAVVGFMDKSECPLFPRWACFLNLWVALLVFPGGLIIFFKTGPFAWNGLFGMWIPLIVFGIWTVVITNLLTKGIKRQAQAG